MGIDSSFKYFYESPRMVLQVSPTSMTSLLSQLYFKGERDRDRERQMNKANCKDRGWLTPASHPLSSYCEVKPHKSTCCAPRASKWGREAFPCPHSQAIALTSTPASRSLLGGFF